MNDTDRDALLVRMDERMTWLVDEHKAHRQDYKDLLVTVNSHGRWLHVGKLLFAIAGGAILTVEWIRGLKP